MKRTSEELEQYENELFLNADHFRLIRFTDAGQQRCETKSFAEAMYLASNEQRILVYAVTRDNRSFCITPERWPYFAALTLANKDSK